MQWLAAVEIALKIIDGIKKIEPIVSKAIDDFTPIGEYVVTKLTGKELTEDQRSELRKSIMDAHNEFQALAPPPGEE